MKSYTDLEQSKELSEILPLESADMFYVYDRHLSEQYGDTPYVLGYKALNENVNIPCWSLSALLSVLPVLKRIGYEKAKPNIYFNTFAEKWICNSLYYTSDSYDNPVDACYEMILKLYELKML